MGVYFGGVAIKIVESITTAFQNILKEPSINTGRHGQVLEKLAKIFDNKTGNFVPCSAAVFQSYLSYCQIFLLIF